MKTKSKRHFVNIRYHGYVHYIDTQLDALCIGRYHGLIIGNGYTSCGDVRILTYAFSTTATAENFRKAAKRVVKKYRG
jgi:hypothetical protein